MKKGNLLQGIVITSSTPVQKDTNGGLGTSIFSMASGAQPVVKESAKELHDYSLKELQAKRFINVFQSG